MSAHAHAHAADSVSVRSAIPVALPVTAGKGVVPGREPWNNRGMTDAAANPCIPYLKALSDENRWRIVKELLQMPLTGTDLVERLGMSQYNVSKHARVLREAGIISTQRRGKHVFFSITPGFQAGLDMERKTLSLGCCTFNFD